MTSVLIELGGHAPVIVCKDTDIHAAATSGAIRKMRNAGQVCTSPTRIFVNEAIFDAFVDTFVARAAQTIVGNGRDAGVEMGPLVNDRRVPDDVRILQEEPSGPIAVINPVTSTCRRHHACKSRALRSCSRYLHQSRRRH